IKQLKWVIAKPHKVETAVDSSKPNPGEILKRDWLMKHRTRVPAAVDAMFDSNHVKRIKPEVHKIEDMVNSYEIDDALFFKCLKLLGRKDEHNYRVIFFGIETEHRLGFLEAFLS
ncbi:hypothetical protein GIB67_042595, partial [Kingdonia uniflora]